MQENLPPKQPESPPSIVTQNQPPTIPLNTPSEIEVPVKSSNNLPNYIIALLMLVLGTGLGIFLFKEFPQTKPVTSVVQTIAKELAVPKDAVQIETCEDTKGSLFVEPNNIPQGPIFMSYKGKVIGVEFMLDLNQIMKDGKFDFLSAQGVNVDHIKFGYLSQGHEGNPVPHFHADLYTVSRQVEEAIKCPPGQSNIDLMPGMNMQATPSATVMPQPTAVQIITAPAISQMQMH